MKCPARQRTRAITAPSARKRSRGRALGRAWGRARSGQGLGCHAKGPERRQAASSRRAGEPNHAVVRARVEHPFRVIKRQFGHVKTRYHWLAKNPTRLSTLFALGNLFMVRRRLMAKERVCPKSAKQPKDWPETTTSAAKNPSRPHQADQAAISAQPTALIRCSLDCGVR